MNQARLLGGAIHAETSNLGLDAMLAALAGRQHGVVGRAQLLAAGVEPTAIKRRVQAGRLHLLYRGVYAVGPPGAHTERMLDGRRPRDWRSSEPPVCRRAVVHP